MSNKFRIVQVGRTFYPERKGLVFWYRFKGKHDSVPNGASGYSPIDGRGFFSIDDAQTYIKNYVASTLVIIIDAKVKQ